MLNENPEENPRPTKNANRKKTTSEPTLTPCMIPPDTPQSSQTLELSQTSNQVKITHLAHLIEETMTSNSQNNVNYDNDETESERQNPELEFTRVFGQGKRPRQANKSKLRQTTKRVR